MKKDQIYARPQNTIEEFRFDEQVTAVFTDMIQRSVPGYDMMLAMIGIITRRFVKPDSRCYDLGCSLGASTLAICHNLPDEDCRIIAVDNAPAMIDECRKNIMRGDASAPVELRCENVLDTEIKDASLVVMNLTLQFISPERRQGLLTKIYRGLNPGGALVLSEKIIAEDESDAELLIELYHDFKRLKGYSDLEIAQKRDALEKVLLPESISIHRERLQKTGFKRVIPWFQCFNFISLLAVK